MSFNEIQELDYFYYLQIKKDAFIYNLSKTEKGRKYLENAHRLTLTTPDRESLRETFGKEGKNG